MKKKTLKVQIRISEYDKNKIKIIADKYAEGNLSAWLIYGALNVDRKHIERKEETLKEAPSSSGGSN